MHRLRTATNQIRNTEAAIEQIRAERRQNFYSSKSEIDSRSETVSFDFGIRTVKHSSSSQELESEAELIHSQMMRDLELLEAQAAEIEAKKARVLREYEVKIKAAEKKANSVKPVTPVKLSLKDLVQERDQRVAKLDKSDPEFWVNRTCIESEYAPKIQDLLDEYRLKPSQAGDLMSQITKLEEERNRKIAELNPNDPDYDFQKACILSEYSQ